MLLGNLSSGSAGNLISGSSLVGGPPRDRAQLLLLCPPGLPLGGWGKGRQSPVHVVAARMKDASKDSVFVLCSLSYIYVYLALYKRGSEVLSETQIWQRDKREIRGRS